MASRPGFTNAHAGPVTVPHTRTRARYARLTVSYATLWQPRQIPILSYHSTLLPVKNVIGSSTVQPMEDSGAQTISHGEMTIFDALLHGVRVRRLVCDTLNMGTRGAVCVARPLASR